MDGNAVDRALEAFDLGTTDVCATRAARGAFGQVWRLRAGPRSYALKGVFSGVPPVDAVVEAEVAFTCEAVAAGVRVPANVRSRGGPYAVPLRDGGWLRLYEWIELRPADLVAQAEQVGEVLARLHRCAPRSSLELDGAVANHWYEVPPALERWLPLVGAARHAGEPWAERLATAAACIPALYDLLTTANPRAMVLCHRDLHPQNLLADPDGALVVVDWDNLGPADPARELAFTLVACFQDGEANLSAIRRAYGSYLAAGGPARLESAADFTMLLAGHLNYLHKQVGVCLDPLANPRDRAWAQDEIDEGLRFLPTPNLLDAILDAL